MASISGAPLEAGDDDPLEIGPESAGAIVTHRHARREGESPKNDLSKKKGKAPLFEVRDNNRRPERETKISDVTVRACLTSMFGKLSCGDKISSVLELVNGRCSAQRRLHNRRRRLCGG